MNMPIAITSEPSSNPDLLRTAFDVVGENLHLYAVAVAYWSLIAAFLGLRYVFRRRRTSDRLRIPILVTGVVAIVVAIIDVATRGQASITHVSLVAYLATPVGIGRYFVARWDGRQVGAMTALGMRLSSYATAFVSFVVLAWLADTPWTLSRPSIDRTDPEALIRDTEWMPFMATVFGLLLIADTVTSLVSIGWDRSRGRSSDADSKRLSDRTDTRT